MINIIVNGCNGTMGQVLCNEIIKKNEMNIIAGIDKNIDKYNNTFPVYKDILDINKAADVIIDFSNPFYLNNLLDYSKKNNTPLVIATTGFSETELNKIRKFSTYIPMFLSYNMSLGINALLRMLKKGTNILSTFDIEIIEKHHNKKIDAPSGTALMIANTINSQLNNSKKYVYNRYSNKSQRKKDELGIHSIRGGNIIGEHTVIFAGEDEIIEIKHSANSKKIFAKGSLVAAQFLIDKKPALYTMDDLFNN
ncbi:4-hydroxy-tetrahydrodipicolinate reductase [Clostridium sp. D2Q-14]|uniref:4-hydroxy-tetrahydrodipicolinate reductase n=1 Tax=Anaeromonas gelatinilytica TaxID=2683194 RepID=UPI00193B2582|nr:4-hydroxy-tetrahydrodipicolinate reductase [Anaeromonas gelatinilytica]MBS4534170.1 4-hydroxy-tetrahydrodipicolinate reductase [Anaeromonas gelatinilytica]